MKKLIGILIFSGLFSSSLWASHHKIEGYTPDDLKWNPMKDRPEEIQTAEVHGSMAKGRHAAFIKFKSGTVMENHSHGANLKVVVISGNFETGPEGELKEYESGSFIYFPAGVVHQTKCTSSKDCVVFVAADKKFDTIPAKGKEGKEKEKK
jgi:quercetin dioxygenase-like cupin family protein